MKYTELINNSILYIEENLQNDIKCQEISENVGYSLYHFNRMFSSLTGETPGNYLRKRRLSEASKELKNTTKKILDISLDYCFGSQEAFTRSFKNMFDINPLEFRNSENLKLKTFEKICIKNYEEFKMLKHRIEKKAKMNLVGLDAHVTGKNFNYAEVWENFMKNHYGKVNNKASYFTTALGIYPENFPEPWEYSYMPSVEVSKIDDIPMGLSLKTIPESNYIVFTHVGSKEKISDSYDYIYSRGLTELGYKSASNYDFEYYDQRWNEENPDTSEMEIWIPIIN
ncbi:MAG: effector binding domain-containing protein [Candidatus Sericytochromatia bacterium]